MPSLTADNGSVDQKTWCVPKIPGFIKTKNPPLHLSRGPSAGP